MFMNNTRINQYQGDWSSINACSNNSQHQNSLIFANWHSMPAPFNDADPIFSLFHTLLAKGAVFAMMHWCP
ncbi:hypothetical protein HBA_0288 [Sodalis endosymbiont of Henestaris halophilus]|nr:hypothetical protein HBA_0288 [Sodalis endosymbiont of Henestaris halophilus]